jgi:NAD(P)H dehydrogenase (quinone)
MLKEPGKYVGRAIMLTGPRSMSMEEHAKEYSREMGRKFEYVNVPLGQWTEDLRVMGGLPEHVYRHIATMAKLHGEGEYDRFTDEVRGILGREAMRMARTVKGYRNVMAVTSDGL